MIRSSAILFLMLTAVLASIPSLPQAHPGPQGLITSGQMTSFHDPPGALTAVNYTYSQANLYTNSSAKPAQEFPSSNFTGTSLTWLSTVNRTRNNAPIQNTGFRFSLTQENLTQGRVVANWTLTVPQFNCSGCTGVSVNFNFFGNLTRGTNATYAVYPRSPPNSTVIASHSYATLGTFPTAVTLGCPENVCVDVTKYRGYNVTLSFSFGWTFSNQSRGMFVEVGEIVVTSIGNFNPSTINVMQQDPSNSSSIIHTTNLSGIKYNNTLTTYVQPGNVSTTKPWWQIEAVGLYYPVGYTIKQVSLNGTIIFPSISEVPFETQHCVPGTGCSQSLIAFNVTDFSRTLSNSNITIISNTPNSIIQLKTLSGGIPTQLFTSGDTIGIKVVNKPSIVNASTTLQTGTLTITFPPALSIQTTSISTAAGGVFNFSLPSTCGSSSQLCATNWSFSAVFTSPYDLGNATSSFRIDLLQVKSFSSTGGNNALSVQGTLEYGNGSAAQGVNATLFAIDHGTPINTPISNSTSIHSTRLYISNVTLVNGVFTQGQSLIMLFTIVNPNATQAYNATVTIEHDWPGPQRHNMTVPVFLGLGDGLGDFAFTNATARTYMVQITFTGSGVQAVVTSVFTNNHTKALVMTQGTSPVVPNRAHAGLFNITITSMINNKTQASPNSILSPTYAYVTPSLAPSRYLYGSPVFQTKSDGSFAATISSDSLLGAKNLTVFVLARDAFGIVVVNNLPSTGFTDSTTLLSNADPVGPVAKGQSATATLHLKSNATQPNGVIEVITVNLIIQGNGMSAQTVAMLTGVTIAPGASQTVTLSFTAPSNTGSYTLTFSSPEYEGPLASQTLQVTILQSNLQILIPAAIGVVAAIIVLGFYLVRRQPDEEKVEEKTRTKPASEKTRPGGVRTSPAKSLTRTQDPRRL